MSRQRMTWGGDGRPATRSASAHPATPWEGETHPAAYPDPEADAYETEDESHWMETPHPPPYRTSPAPAVPYDDGGYRHPATQPGAPARNASMNVRVAAERKAAKCIRIASALLGPNVTVAAEGGDKVASDLIEDQALDFMDMSDARIASTLLRLEAATDDPDTLLRKMLAGGEVEEEEEAEEEVEAKKASRDLQAALQSIRTLQAEVSALKSGRHASTDRQAFNHMAEDESLLAQMVMEEKMGGRYMAEDDAHMAEGDDEALLAQMMMEEKMGGRHMAEGDDESLLAQMMMEEKMGGRHMAEADDESLLAQMMMEEKMGGRHMAEDVVSEEDAMLAEMLRESEAAPMAPMAQMAPAPQMTMSEDDEAIMGGYEDPMAMGEGEAMSAEEEAVLASLFASRQAGDDGAEDEEVEEEEVEEEEEEEEEAKPSKTASLRPQPKKPLQGARTIGVQTRVASGGGGGALDDLARLWASAPDVTAVFKG